MEDRQKLAHILRAQLAFLEQGGYRPGARYPWRPKFVFEDSPTCINYPPEKADLQPCTECPLIEFVREEQRDTRFPCRYICLTERGETVNSFYEWGTEAELETALAGWLRRKIHELEAGERTTPQQA